MDSLVNTERAFAEYAGNYGTNKAFLKFLSDESLLFNPYPMNGKEIYASQKEDSSYLYWEPIYAEISSSGDMGFTYGPWIYKQKKELHDSLAAYGFFLTVWKKENGNYKAAADGGVVADAKNWFKKPVVINYLPEGKAGYESTGSLQESEQEFQELAASSGYETALERFSDGRTLILTNGFNPGASPQHKPDFMKDVKCEWEIVKTETSANNDLGYVIGKGKILDDEREFSLYRIWRKGESGWKIAVENIRPIKK